MVTSSPLAEAIRRGHYAAKQIHCPNPLIAWSHSRRFQIGLELANCFLTSGAKVLDHGCGDGTFLAMLLGESPKAEIGVGTEITPQLVADCRTRFDGIESLEFVRRDEIVDGHHAGTFDLITCMEVLEHVVEVEHELRVLSDLLKPGAVLIVSVPVETGLPLVIKQVVRRFAGWRGLGDYPGDAPYTFAELAKSVFAGPRPHIRRPKFPTGEGLPPHHSHRGFNWMVLKRLLETQFDVVEVLASPLRRLPPHLNSQAWFIARKRTQF